MKPTKKTEYPIHDLLSERWSPRSFSDKEVAQDDLKKLFEAARWAASSRNEQPWSFIVGNKYDNIETWSKILDCLAEGNQGWAKNAPILVVSIIKTNFSHNNSPNNWAAHDLGLAVGNLTMQAGDLGISLHQMGGIDASKAKSVFDIPNGYEVLTAIAIGYVGSADDLEEGWMRESELGEQKRKNISDFIFTNNWGEELWNRKE